MIKRRYAIIVDAIFIALIPTFWLISKLMMFDTGVCAVRKSGYLCPACGGTRCVYYFMRGDFLNSFMSNPYLFLSAFISGIYLIVYNVYFLSKGQYFYKTYNALFRPYYLIIWAVGFTLFGILRNFI